MRRSDQELVRRHLFQWPQHAPPRAPGFLDLSVHRSTNALALGIDSWSSSSPEHAVHAALESASMTSVHVLEAVVGRGAACQWASPGLVDRSIGDTP
jgi:hypothetical protein